MDRLIHTAHSGMRASMDHQRVIASNMANANTLGFRAELFDQRSVTIEGQPNEARALQAGSVRSADMTAGQFIKTDRELDVAIATKSMMAVQASDGTEAYTRRGDLSVSPTGLLVNGAGRVVLGDTGPITVPPDGIPSIPMPPNSHRPKSDGSSWLRGRARRLAKAWTVSSVSKVVESSPPTRRPVSRLACSSSRTSTPPKSWSI